MTLKQTRPSGMLIVSSLIFEYQRTLLVLRSDLSGTSAPLRGQAAVHFAFE